MTCVCPANVTDSTILGRGITSFYPAAIWASRKSPIFSSSNPGWGIASGGGPYTFEYVHHTGGMHLRIVGPILFGLLILVVVVGGVPQMQAATGCHAGPSFINGTVDRVVDGDTLVVCNRTVRLALVDTPECAPDTDCGRSVTKSICPPGAAAQVRIDAGQPTGPYGRTIGAVTCDGVLLNHRLLEQGAATVLPRYCARSAFSDALWAQRYGCG